TPRGRRLRVRILRALLVLALPFTVYRIGVRPGPRLLRMLGRPVPADLLPPTPAPVAPAYRRCAPPLRWWTCRLHTDGGCTYPPLLVCPLHSFHAEMGPDGYWHEVSPDGEWREDAQVVFAAYETYRPEGHPPPDAIECHLGVDPGAVFYPKQDDGGVPC